MWCVVRRTGRIGLSSAWRSNVSKDREEVLLQFGPSGPFRWYSERSVRAATNAEITAANLDGVGTSRLHYI